MEYADNCRVGDLWNVRPCNWQGCVRRFEGTFSNVCDAVTLGQHVAGISSGKDFVFIRVAMRTH
jgi:hypothetical protein